MASITIGSTSGLRPHCILTVTQGAQNIGTNTTTVNYSLVLKRPSPIYSEATKKWSVTINGTTRSGTGTNGGSGDKTLLSGSVAVVHSANGTKTINFSASCLLDVTWSGTYLGTISGSGSMGLTTIPRASSFGTVSGSTMGSSVTVNITRASSSFTHQLWYRVGSSAWVDLGTGIGTSKAFTPPLSMCSNITNGTSGTLGLCIRTLNGTTRIGSDVYKNVSINIPSSVVPSISSVSVSEANGLAAKFGGYVKNKSAVNVTVNAAGIYGSTITTYSTKIEGVNYSAKTFKSNNLAASGTVAIAAKVTDSRGRTATKSVSISVVDYFIPNISNFMAQRCNSDGALNENGTYCKCSFTYSIAPVNSKNDKTIKLQYLNGSTWTDITSWNSLYTSSLSYIKMGYSVDETFQFRVVVTDYFGTSTSNATLNPSFTLMNFNASGKGLGVGMMSNKDAFQVGLVSEFSQVVSTFNGVKCTSINPIASTANDTVQYWVGQNNSIHFFNKTGCLLNQPGKYGILVNFCVPPNDVSQIWFTQPYGDMWTRGGNSSSWYSASWRRLGYNNDVIKNKVLWSGNSYMFATQKCQLTEPVSIQPKGIVLVFSQYAAGGQNSDFNTFFVPKEATSLYKGAGHSFFLTNSNGSIMAIKYLYVHDTEIAGNDQNDDGSKTASGITLQNNKFALRYVIGV